MFRKALLLTSLLTLASQGAFADFALGVSYFESGQLEKAYSEFKQAASYGSLDAQYNLGAMYFQGQYVEKDLVKSYGWFSLFEHNSEKETTPLAEKIYARLDVEQRQKADAFKESLLSKYSTSALLESWSPDLDYSGSSVDNYEVVRKVVPRYPSRAARLGKQGWVDLSYTIGADGTTRDHLILYAANSDLGDAAVEAMRQWQFEPRKVDGRPTDITGIRMRMMFTIEGTRVIESRMSSFLKEAREKAETGSNADQFEYAYSLGAARSLAHSSYKDVDVPELQDNANRWFEKSAASGNASAAYFLGLNTLQGRYCEQDTYKSAGWLHRSAMLGGIDAKYTLAVEYMSGALFEVDRDKAMYWLKQVAESLPHAKVRYARYLVDSDALTQENVDVAEKLLSQVDESDYVDKLTFFQAHAEVAAAKGDTEAAIKWQEELVDEAEDLELPLAQYQGKLDSYRQTLASASDS